MKSSISYSEFSTALQCLQKYKLLHIDKIVEHDVLQGDLLFGSALHNSINAALSQDADAEIVFDLQWTSYQDKAVSYGRFKWKELYELGQKFISKFIRLHLRKFEPILMEERLYSNFQGIKLEGTPDYFGTYNGTPVLLDFKTSAYSYAKEKVEAPLQLYFYAHLLESRNFIPEKIGYMVFCKSTGAIQGPILSEYSRDRMNKIMLDFSIYYSKFNSGHYPKNPNHCIIGSNVCGFFEKCWSKK